MLMYSRDGLFGTKIVKFHPALNTEKGVSVYSHSWTSWSPFKVGEARAHPYSSAGIVEHGIWRFLPYEKDTFKIGFNNPIPSWPRRLIRLPCRRCVSHRPGFDTITPRCSCLTWSQALPVGELCFPKAFQRQNDCFMVERGFWYSWWWLLFCGVFEKLEQDLESLKALWWQTRSLGCIRKLNSPFWLVRRCSPTTAARVRVLTANHRFLLSLLW